ncbi:MAG: protein BatD [Verrucomicrobia bacterium]|nr:protein BatD [Verrucomicrobiota bacterium]
MNSVSTFSISFAANGCGTHDPERRALLGIDAFNVIRAGRCPALQFFGLMASARLVLCLAIFLLLSLNSVQAAAFTATLDRDTTSVGESVTLSLTFEGGAPKAAPNIPAISGLAIRYGGQSSQHSFVNGRVSSSVIFNYAVTPTKVGDYEIPAFQTVIEGKTIATQPLKLKVSAAAAPGSQEEQLKQFVYLKLILPKTEFYVGEVFPVEIRLYSALDAQELQAPQLASEGFTFGKLQQVPETRTQIGNYVYHLLAFKMTATAAKTGRLTLGPAQCTLTLKVPTNNRRRSDPFDAFDDAFGSFFGNRVQLLPKTLVSETFTVQVNPLPKANAPSGFGGAVGNFTMAVTVSPTNVAVGDPITIKTQISGAGALDNLALPALDGWKEFKTYPATSKVETSDELGLQGTKMFEQVVVPQNTEIKVVPELAFSFFDPNLKGYRTLKQAPTPVVVRPAGATQLPPSVPADTTSPRETPAIQDIVHIKPNLGVLTAAGLPLIQQRWFVALQSLPVAVFFAAFLRRKRNERLANNPRLRRKRQVAQTVQAGLSELREHAKNQQPEEFFATVFRLLQEQLGERLNQPASGITEAVIEERLRPHGVNADMMGELHELFQTCNQARYAGHRSAKELAALVPKVESAVKDLKKLPDDF